MRGKAKAEKPFQILMSFNCCLSRLRRAHSTKVEVRLLSQKAMVTVQCFEHV